VRRKQVKIGSFRESYFPREWLAVKDWFEKIRSGFDPEIVFTHYRDLACNALRNHLILEYEILKYDGDLGRPNVFLPLSAQLCARKNRVAPETL
jgi:hypothetical protein